MRSALHLSVPPRLLALAALVTLGLGALLLPGRFPEPVSARPLSNCTGGSLAVSPTAPQTVGTSVTLTASATGCSSPLFLYYEEQAVSGSSWVPLGTWTSGSYTWNTTGVAAGGYTLDVWAKDSGSTNTYDVNNIGGAYWLNDPNGCTGGSLSYNPVSPAPVGAQVVLTATATGCHDSGPLYKYFVKPSGGSWSVIQD